MGKDRETEKQEMLEAMHLSVQQMAVRLGAPLTLGYAILMVAIHRNWQTAVFLAWVVAAAGTWMLCLRLTRQGLLKRSVLLFSLSVIGTGGLFLNLFGSAIAPAVLAAMLAVIYASLYSHKQVWITSATTVFFIVSSVFVSVFQPWTLAPIHDVLHLAFGTAFSVFLMGMIVLVLLKNRQLDSRLSHRMSRLNEEQWQVIGTAGALSAVLEESLRRIKTIAGSFASQADEQAAAIAQIHTTMELVREISSQTASSAAQTRALTEGVRGKSLATSHQLKNVEQEFDKVVETNNVAQAEFDDLAAQAERIEDILRTNREIAAQIKILAVNAGIQAAKAGNFGAGFRVVAGELKAMIQRTEDSLSSSRKLLEDIRTRARQSADTVQHNSALLRQHFDELGATGRVIEEINGSFADTAQRIEAINVAAVEQQMRLDSVAVGIDYIDTAATDLTASTQELIEQVARIVDSHQELRIVLESSSRN